MKIALYDLYRFIDQHICVIFLYFICGQGFTTSYCLRFKKMLNPSYFSTLFKQMTGSSFKDYLNYIRIEESKKLLTNTNGTILDIPLAVGFENQSYFTKVFKKYTGITPKQYRN